MISRTVATLEAKRARLAENEKGFTLIELLVVVIIIGILAAIAIPIFLGQQESAKDSAVKADLANAKNAVIAYQVDNPADTSITLDDATLGDYGFTTSEFTDYVTTTVDPTADFTISATRIGGGSFTISSTGGVSPSPAP